VIIPMSAWGTAPKRMLQYIPIGNIADGTFASGAYKRRINDNKFGGRLDFNSNRFGTSSIYYFNDRYNLDDPYPSGLGGATLPGNGFAYDATSLGVDQTVVFSNIHTFGVNTVNEARFGITRLDNTLEHPRAESGPRLPIRAFRRAAKVSSRAFHSRLALKRCSSTAFR